MVRQNINPNPEQKYFEAYVDFSGGLNTEISNEKLKDNECSVLENADLSGRGSAKRRYGRILKGTQAGTAQGLFTYYRLGAAYPDLIAAIGGQLFVFDAATGSHVQIPITDGGSAFTFQTTLDVEAVQYGTSMFIATGTKLVELTYSASVWTAVTITPYTPTSFEALYIGVNGLAANPYAYIQDAVTSTLVIEGIQPTKRSGTVNQAVTMTAYIGKPAGVASVDYQWEYKKTTDAAWTVGLAWATGAPGKTWDFAAPTADNWDIRASIRDTAVPATVIQSVISPFKVNQVEDKTNSDLPYSGINSCRGIKLHWDRLILYKDSTYGYQMYVSDLQNPRYFPVTNTLVFDTGKQESVTAVVRFQDMLVVFTKTTVQTLVGKSPADYSRSLIHDGLGCIASRTAKVVRNNIVFLSHDGMQSLIPNPYHLEVFNVKRIDTQIKSELPRDIDACALVHDLMYWVCFPAKKLIYRYYYETGVWVKDVSTKLDIAQFLEYGDDVYNLSVGGLLYKHDRTVFDDAGEAYDLIVDSRYLSLSETFNKKKLRRVYVLVSNRTNALLKVRVYADNEMVLNPESGEVIIDADGARWEVSSAPNMEFYAGSVFGQWVIGKSPFGIGSISEQRASVRGKCKRAKVSFTHSDPTPCEIIGFGLEFSLNRP